MVEVYARLASDVVVEIVHLPDGSLPIQRLYHPDVVAQMRRLEGADATSVVPGWVYNDEAWHAPPPPEVVPAPIAYVPASLARERLERDGFWDQFSAILASNPAAMLKVLTLRDGIDPNDQQAVALIGASGADPARILAPPGTEPEPPTQP